MLVRLFSPGWWGAFLDQVWLWHVTGVLLGWLVFPVAFGLFRPLYDRGYAVSRILGAFLLTYIHWLLCHGLMRASASSLAFALAFILAPMSLLQIAREGRGLADFLHARWKALLAAEGLALVLFLLLINIRSYAPDINYNPSFHGAEKLANMMILSSLWRAESFPAADAWLAADREAAPEDPAPGINYYYGGHLQWATLARLTGQPPPVAFNLALATLFAWIGMGAFGLAINLTGRLRFGIVAALVLVFAGNLEPLDQIARDLWPAYKESKAREIAFLESHPDAASYPVARHALMDSYRLWDASRVILRSPMPSGTDLTVNEFPYFSFILGDLHAHSSALPLTLLLLHVLLALYQRKDGAAWTWGNCARCYPHAALALCLIVGGLYWYNTWDMVPLAIWLSALLFWDSYDWKIAPWRGWAGNAALLAILFAVGVLALLGMHTWTFQSPLTNSLEFQEKAAGIRELWQARPWPDGEFLGAIRDLAGLIVQFRPRHLSSRAYEMLLFWGLICFPLACLMIADVAGRVKRARSGQRAGFMLSVAAFGAALLAMKSGGVALPICLAFAAAAGLLAWREDRGANERFAARMAFGGFCVVAVAEMIYINDSMAGEYVRYNTVFKLYYPAWALLTIAAVTLYHFTDQRLGENGRRIGRMAWRAMGAALLALGAVYPVLATYSRTDGFFSLESDAERGFYVQRNDEGLRRRTLDGLEYLNSPERSPDDLAAIRWLNENVKGRPHILESAGGAYNETGRVAAYTGLPTVMGWQNHELQWRGWRYWAQMQAREHDVAELFTTTDLADAVELLRRYDIAYVFWGSRERELYGATGLGKFAVLGRETFRSGETVVYVMADFAAAGDVGIERESQGGRHGEGGGENGYGSGGEAGR